MCGWVMSQKLPVNSFKWKTNMLKSDKEFIRNYDENSNKGYILEVTTDYPKDLHDLHSDLPFLSEKIETCINLYAICMIKKTILFT